MNKEEAIAGLSCGVTDTALRSDAFRLADEAIRAILDHSEWKLGRRDKSRLIAASSVCRVEYIKALTARYGEEETVRILSRLRKSGR